MSTIHGNNFDLPLPEIVLNGDVSLLGTVNASEANTYTDDGTLNGTGGRSPHLIPGEPLQRFTQIRKLGEFMYQYINVPTVSNPATVTITVPANSVVHYTYGPQYPTIKVDRISCFEYSGPIQLTNNKGQDGTFIYAVAFQLDSNQKPLSNNQSPLLIAKFRVTKA